VYVVDERVENVTRAYFHRVLVAAKDAKECAGPRVPVHEKLEQILAARILFEAIVAEFNALTILVIRQVEDEVAKGRTRVEHNLAHVYFVETREQLIREAKCGIQVAIRRHTPYVNDTVGGGGVCAGAAGCICM